ncbi:hypothetical protein HYW74_01675 [Candidatus Pacearchaeota archaeon]|nr:hypothetical protein [Candidatus Pacearchaeota archaeon]
MGFFSRNKDKKEDKVPELPKLPPLPDLPQLPESKREQDNFSLPSLPSSNIGQRINQDMIKGAVSGREDEENDLTDMPTPSEPLQRSRVQEISGIKGMQQSRFSIPKELIKPRTLEMSNSFPSGQRNFEFQETRTKKSEPLFIKLDKYESTLSTFNEIKLRVGEIESLLRNIKEIKSKEERELDDWEREIQTIKARLDQVDRELFKNI